MPTNLNSVPLMIGEMNRRTARSFVVRIRVCPLTGYVELASVEATGEPPTPGSYASSGHVYLLPLLMQQGRNCEVYVIAEIADRGESQQVMANRVKPRPTRRSPKTPGLCGGVITVPSDQDDFDGAPPAVHERVTREYDELLERLNRSTALRATHT